jgi:hypothetical protein
MVKRGGLAPRFLVLNPLARLNCKYYVCLMRKKTAKRRIKPMRFLLSGAIFTTILVIIVVARVVTFTTVAATISCQDMRTIQYGETALESGVFDTLSIVVLLLGILILCVAISGLSRRDFSKMDIGLGAVNLLLVLGLAIYCAIPWAFNHPTAPFAKQINGLNQVLGVGSSISQVRADPNAPYRVSSNWVETAPNEWRSESLYLVKKYEIVWECFPEGFVQENASARSRHYNPELPSGKIKYGYSYYSLNGEYMTSGEVYWWNNAPYFMPYEFMPYEVRRENPENWSVGERLERDLLLLLSEIKAEDSEEELRLYTREEIEAMVEENWKDAD